MKSRERTGAEPEVSKGLEACLHVDPLGVPFLSPFLSVLCSQYREKAEARQWSLLQEAMGELGSIVQFTVTTIFKCYAFDLIH